MAGTRDGFALLHFAGFFHTFFPSLLYPFTFAWPFFSCSGCFYPSCRFLFYFSKMSLHCSTFTYIPPSLLLLLYFSYFYFYFTSPPNCIMSFFPFLFCQKRLMTFFLFHLTVVPHLTSPHLTSSTKPPLTNLTYPAMIFTYLPTSLSPILPVRLILASFHRVCRKKYDSHFSVVY